MKCVLVIFLVLSVLCTLLKAAPQSQVFGGGECNRPNTEFRRCEYSTRATCLVPQPNSDEFASHCEDGCFCKRGYYYNSNNRCVLLQDCDVGPQATQEEHEEEEDEDVSDI